jgi:cysteinyl-tRNA synthetase
MFRFLENRPRLRFHNTLSGKKEFFKPYKGNTVKMYTCGPTVYDFAHIGNLRTYIFEDILRRTIKLVGYDVLQAMNITNVEDKIIKVAIESGKSISEITGPFEKHFLEDLRKLNIETPEKMPRATDCIDEMIALIKKLMEKGYAYKGEDGSVYFSVSKFKDYGKLSRPDMANQKSVARVSSDEYDKTEVQDFALWKAKKDGEPSWDSPWGAGRPGWHIECSAMSMKELGDTLDIHTGGVDNAFPHHENEIAQSEAVTGKPFSRFFIHGEHLLVSGAKMAKSAGNFFTLRDIENKGYDPLAFRYLCLQAHYRSKMNFTWEALDSASIALQNIRKLAYSIGETGGTKRNREKERDILKALSDDLNAPEALATLWEALKSNDISQEEKRSLVVYADRVLGLGLSEVVNSKNHDIPDSDSSLAEERNALRKSGNFEGADAIRKTLEEKGYEVVDERDGYELRRRYNGQKRA